MRGFPVGILLGLANVFVIGVGMAAVGHEAGIALLVLMFGSIPAIVVGALLGWIADAMKAMPVWARRLVLIVPAVLLVIVLGTELWMKDFIFVSCIPTTVATFILERATRLTQRPPVPPAQVVR
jgi:hypothetical protein